MQVPWNEGVTEPRFSASRALAPVSGQAKLTVTTPDSYPDKLRRIKVRDAERGKTLVFLTNNWALPASTIAELYR